MSGAYFEGATIDYKDDKLNGSAFVISNPNAKSTCGCGSSAAFQELTIHVWVYYNQLKFQEYIMELNRDGDGFLINIDDWSEEVMYQMAESDSFEITDEIKTYIDKAREMYGETGTVPAVRNFAKEFNMDRKASKLYEVFQSGPMKKIAKYGGLPKPTGCV